MRAWLGAVVVAALIGGGSAGAQEPEVTQPEVEAGPDAVEVPEPGTEEQASQPVEDPGEDTGDGAQPTEEGPAVDVPEPGTEERAAEPEIVPGPVDEGTIWQETCECPCPVEEGATEGEDTGTCECPCPLEGGAVP